MSYRRSARAQCPACSMPGTQGQGDVPHSRHPGQPQTMPLRGRGASLVQVMLPNPCCMAAGSCGPLHDQENAPHRPITLFSLIILQDKMPSCTFATSRCTLTTPRCKFTTAHCKLHMTRCTFTMPHCKLHMPRCMFTTSRCKLHMTRCTFTMPHCKLHLPRYMFTTSRCKLHMTRCTFTMPHCKLHMPRCMFTTPHCKLHMPRCMFTMPRCKLAPRRFDSPPAGLFRPKSRCIAPPAPCNPTIRQKRIHLSGVMAFVRPWESVRGTGDLVFLPSIGPASDYVHPLSIREEDNCPGLSPGPSRREHLSHTDHITYP